MPRMLDMRTSGSYDAYETPQWLVKEIKRYFGGAIDLDPCTSDLNPVGADMFLTSDGLEQLWGMLTTSSVYVNSPYGRELPKWVGKCVSESTLNPDMEIIQLLPARFGSRWFRDMAESCGAFGVFDKRLSFTINGQPVTDKNGRPCTAQFDTCLVYFGPNAWAFKEWFSDYLTYWSLA